MQLLEHRVLAIDEQQTELHIYQRSMRLSTSTVAHNMETKCILIPSTLRKLNYAFGNELV